MSKLSLIEAREIVKKNFELEMFNLQVEVGLTNPWLSTEEKRAEEVLFAENVATIKKGRDLIAVSEIVLDSQEIKA